MIGDSSSAPILRGRAERLLKRLLSDFLRLFFRSRKKVTSLTPLDLRSVLVVRQHDQLGDMLCAIPLLRALRMAYPGARLTLVASRVNDEIMQFHPLLDTVLTYDKALFLRSPLAIVRFLGKLRRTRADIALVPATVSLSFTSDLLALLSGAPVRVGPASLSGAANPSSFCFTHTVDLDWGNDPRRHQALRTMDILKALDIRGGDLTPEIGLTDSERREAKKLLLPLRKKHSVLIGMHPGAGKPPNRWPAERFARLAEHLTASHRAGILVTAGPMDDEPLAALLQSLKDPPLLIRNRPIRIVAALLDQLDLYITNDTGVLHIAGALSPDVIGLFGPTDPLQWAPTGSKNRFICAKDGRVDSITLEEVLVMAEASLSKKMSGQIV